MQRTNDVEMERWQTAMLKRMLQINQKPTTQRTPAGGNRNFVLGLKGGGVTNNLSHNIAVKQSFARRLANKVQKIFPCVNL